MSNETDDKMTKENFLAMVRNVELQARNHVKAAQLIAENSNRALDRLAAHDPGLVALLKEGIAARGRNSQRVLDYIRSRTEKQ